jgi:DnaK suppressor protein
MLFVSLLQGFGFLPGRVDSAAHAPAVAEPVAPEPGVSVREVPKQGITPKAPTARSKAAVALAASEAKTGPATRQRRDAVKKSAEKPATPAQTKASASKKAPVAVKKAAPAAPAQPAAPAKATPVARKTTPAPVVKVAVAVPVASSAKPKAVKATPQTTASPPPSVPERAAPVVVAPPVVPATRRGGRKSAAVAVPTPQPKPSHSPDAAKATFSNFPERVMTPLVHSPARKDPKLANNWKSKPVEQLLDEEVLSMPDAEYMNDTQMAFFRRKLVILKQDILANAGQTTENLREDTVVVPDPADRATIEEEHALELRTRDRERKLLKKIEQSIARIDSGDYGYCDETGEPIGVGRLIARPTASLSLEAQQRRELKQKMFGD